MSRAFSSKPFGYVFGVWFEMYICALRTSESDIRSDGTKANSYFLARQGNALSQFVARRVAEVQPLHVCTVECANIFCVLDVALSYP